MLCSTSEVLLADQEETYQFIEKMIDSATKPFKSKKIHIGMDEAHGLGEGRYRQLFGSKQGYKIFTEHLKQVNQICLKKELEPFIWSDSMYFFYEYFMLIYI